MEETKKEVIENEKTEEIPAKPEKKSKLAELKNTLQEALNSDSGSEENATTYKVVGVAAAIACVLGYEVIKNVWVKYDVGGKIVSAFNKDARSARKQARKDKVEIKSAANEEATPAEDISQQENVVPEENAEPVVEVVKPVKRNSRSKT